MNGRLPVLAVLAALALPGGASANGFMDFYAPRPRAEGGDAIARAPAMAGTGAGMSFMPSAAALAAIPGLDDVSGSLKMGGDTLVPGLGDRVIPTASGGHADAAPMDLAASGPGADASVCIRAIRAAEAAHGIPENLLMAIGLQEAGRKKDGQLTIWPWSVNSHGKTSMFDNKAEAIRFVQAEKAAGRTLIDVGCMQVNQHWHPDAYASLEEAFDPQASADYAAAFLARLHRDAGDWMKAAGNYHSFTPRHHDRYVAGIRRNLDVALAMSGDFDRLAAGGSVPAEGSGASRAPAIASAAGMRQNGGASLAGGRGYQRVAMLLPAGAAAPAPAPAPEAAAPPPPLAGAWWSSGGADGPARSIYSRQDLQPVLPVVANEAPAEGALQGD